MEPLLAPRLDECKSNAAKFPRTSPNNFADGFPLKDVNSNLFEIYMREAKVYDTAMVERWRTAMEGLLIFVSAER